MRLGILENEDIYNKSDKAATHYLKFHYQLHLMSRVTELTVDDTSRDCCSTSFSEV
jgi:hypothetical protein